MPSTMDHNLFTIGKKRSDLTHIFNGGFCIPITINKNNWNLTNHWSSKIITDIRTWPNISSCQ